MSWNEAFKPVYHANVQQPNLPVIGPGKIPPLSPSAERSVTDALFAEHWTNGTVKLAITSPNMETRVWPHHGWCSLQMDKNWRFKQFDPMFAPQLWRSRVPHYATIPFPSANWIDKEYRLLCLWKLLDKSAFRKHAKQSALNGLKMYKLKKDKMQSLHGAVRAQGCLRQLPLSQWLHTETRLQVSADIITQVDCLPLVVSTGSKNTNQEVL
ncbi:hypothetical protein CYLTODRAFT_494926 [Cylindrobasidium torrendii FP15055 ss-10]|uniref:Uncharacterized protein n=1 Tax=Cylindrobasidium torrendii FP15055 ss-10 TaxID=1314674 RepID=A0A0D7AVY9_9AGAR|nr:hypothetical protein CYLTODRAFT_494926 [Cylindrobasidium torrendii FP15055 ss-10]